MRMNYFKYYLALCFLLGLPTFCWAQANSKTISGQVINEQNKPMELVNITLLELPDSTFIKGVVSDSQGVFSLELPQQSVHKHYLLSFSYLGYETRNLALESKALHQAVVLKPAPYAISELTVVGHKNPYVLDGSKIKAQISGSTLSTVGNAFDVMRHLTFLRVEGTNVNVFGKGKPLIFINKREVRSTVDLNNLDSKRIKSITINTTPGAEHLASATAIIHIETLREEGEGMSGIFNVHAQRRNDWSESGNLYLSYVNRGFTLYGDLSGTNGRAKQSQLTSTYLRGKDLDTQESAETQLQMSASDYSSSLGFDYDIAKNHQIGAVYRFNNQWKGRGNALSNNIFYESQLKQEEYQNSMRNVGKSRDNYLNFFYSGDINSWKLEFDADYLSGKGSGGAESLITYTDGEQTSVNSSSKNKKDFFASRLYARKKVNKSTFLLGTQFTWTDSKYYYTNQESHADLPSSFSHNKQLLYGLFGSFASSIGDLRLNMGLRYEQVKFDYYLNKEYKKDQSIKDNYFFPTVVLSYPIPKQGINMSLSYRRTINRPTYYNLRADIQYNSPHAYEAGNPSLKNVFVNDLSYNFKFKRLLFISSYKIYENQVSFVTKQFEDKPITLATFINAKKYRTLSFSLSYYHTLFDVWTPQIELSYQKPFLKHSFGDQLQRYNRPEYAVSLDNTISLPLAIILRASLEYNSPSDSEFSRTRNTFIADLHLQKEIKDKLSIRLGVQDIFNSNKEKWSMNYENVLVNKQSFSNPRSFYISFSYSFNRVSQYQRSGANQKELNRL